MNYHIAVDDLYPRDLEHRYRVYMLLGDKLTLMCATPDAGGIGEAIVSFHEDQRELGRRLADLGTLGVLDVIAGEWIVLPWSRNLPPVTFGKQAPVIGK